MKPREFDELIRQKFDQNDFEYNPRNWGQLEEQLDGPKKKRSIIMWWLMPVAGIAASVALAMGVAPVFHPTLKQDAPLTHTLPARPAQAPVNVIYDDHAQRAQNEYNVASTAHHTRAARTKATAPEKEETFGIDLQNALANTRQAKKTNINLLNANTTAVVKKEREKKRDAAEDVMSTFIPEVEEKAPTLSVILAGGYAHGTQSNGYNAGAIIRKEISQRVFIEGHVAFASSNMQQDMVGYEQKQVTVANVKDANGNLIASYIVGAGKTGGKISSTAKTTDGSSTDYVTKIVPGRRLVNNVSFDLSYAEINPALGVKVLRKLSVAGGPDFQQALSDKRPAPDPTNIDANSKYPLFDIGFMGKAEYSVTRSIKAGVSYRKGMNSVIAPGANYIERDYLMFQLNCAVFHR